MDSFLKDFVSQRLTESNLDKLSRNDIPSQKASCLYKETVHSHRRRWHKSIRFLRTHERFLTSKDFSKLVSPSFCTAGIFFTPNENKFVCVTINMMKHVFKLLVYVAVIMLIFTGALKNFCTFSRSWSFKLSSPHLIYSIPSKSTAFQ